MSRRIDWITLHTAAASTRFAGKLIPLHQTSEEIDKYHRGKGWRDIGYHEWIEVTGKVGACTRDIEEEPAAVEGFNAHIIAIGVSGHGDLEAWNSAQLKTVIDRCEFYCRMFKLSASCVIGHNETDEKGGPKVFKTCPGNLIDMNKIRNLVFHRLVSKPSLELRVEELERKIRILEARG